MDAVIFGLRWLRCLLAVTIICALGTSAKAYDDYYVEILRAFEDVLRPSIEATLPRDERDVVRGVDLQVRLSPFLPDYAYAFQSPAEIRVSIGFLGGLFQTVDCLLLESQPGLDVPPNYCDDYFAYFILGATNLDTPYPPSVARFYFSTQEAVDAWYAQPQLAEARNVMMSSAVIFVLMHEFGHHVEGFYSEGDSLSTKRAVEAAADQWAARRLDEIGENPVLGAVLSLLYVARLEAHFDRLVEARQQADSDYVEPDVPHPSPAQRVSWSFDRFCTESVLSSSGPEQRACALLQDAIDQF